MLDRATADAWQCVMALVKRSRFSPSWRRATRGYETLWNALRSRVAERRAGQGGDLFSRMCRVGPEAAAWLDDDALVRLAVTTLLAAFDTTSFGAASMAYLLAKHPAWQERLHAEGQRLDRGPLTVEGVKQLEEHEWVWKETLRLYPVAGLIGRQALRETQLGPHRIPEGALVTAMTGSVMRDPAWWSAPDEFEPERFSPARAEDKRHRAIFLPFGAGAHTCIGAQLANLEVKAFWRAMIARCRFTMAPDYAPRHGYSPLGTISGEVGLALAPR